MFSEKGTQEAMTGLLQSPTEELLHSTDKESRHRYRHKLILQSSINMMPHKMMSSENDKSWNSIKHRSFKLLELKVERSFQSTDVCYY
jgi:hypothetical protein